MIHSAALRVFGVLPRVARTAIIRTLYPTFTAGVGVCFVDPRGRIALVRHSYSPGWGLPGGLVGRNEEFRAAAERELDEELGLTVALAGPPLPVLTPGRRHLNFLFRAELDTHAAAGLASHSPEITAVGWYEVDQLPDLADFTDLFLEALGFSSPD